MHSFLNNLHPLVKYPLFGVVIAEICSIGMIVLSFRGMRDSGYSSLMILVVIHALHFCYFVIPTTICGLSVWKLKGEQLKRVVRYAVFGFCISYFLSPFFYIISVPLFTNVTDIGGVSYENSRFVPLFCLYTIMITLTFAIAGALSELKYRLASAGLVLSFIFCSLIMQFSFIGMIVWVGSFSVPVLIYLWLASDKRNSGIS